MRFIRTHSLAIGAIFTVVSLFATEEPHEKVIPLPPEEEAVALPQPFSPNVAEVIVPTVPDKKDQDKTTDRFLKGGFCILSALFFVAGFLIVKSSEGHRTYG